MKVRSGFVSNSSSSSFILFIPQNNNTFNSITEFKHDMKKNGYCDDEIEDMMVDYQKTLQLNIDNGLGFMLESISYGGEDDIERIVNSIGGNVIWME